MSFLYSVFNVLLTGGDEQIRTVDPLLARQVLSQLSYTPILGSLSSLKKSLVGLSGLEPPTSRLSGVRSNRLSYRPMQGILWVLISFNSHISYSFVQCSSLNTGK